MKCRQVALCAAKSLWKMYDNYLLLKSPGLLLGLHLVFFKRTLKKNKKNQAPGNTSKTIY